MFGAPHSSSTKPDRAPCTPDTRAPLLHEFKSLHHAVICRRAAPQRARDQRPCAREPAGASTATTTNIQDAAALRPQLPARFELRKHGQAAARGLRAVLPWGSARAALGQHAQADARAPTALPGQRAAPAGLPRGAPRALRQRAQAGARAPHAAAPRGGARRLRGRAAPRRAHAALGQHAQADARVLDEAAVARAHGARRLLRAREAHQEGQELPRGRHLVRRHVLRASVGLGLALPQPRRLCMGCRIHNAHPHPPPCTYTREHAAPHASHARCASRDAPAGRPSGSRDAQARARVRHRLASAASPGLAGRAGSIPAHVQHPGRRTRRVPAGHAARARSEHAAAAAQDAPPPPQAPPGTPWSPAAIAARGRQGCPGGMVGGREEGGAAGGGAPRAGAAQPRPSGRSLQSSAGRRCPWRASARRVPRSGPILPCPTLPYTRGRGPRPPARPGACGRRACGAPAAAAPAWGGGGAGRALGLGGAAPAGR